MGRNERIDQLTQVVQTLIVQGHRRIAARLDLTRVEILGLIAADGPVRPAMIAARLELTKSTVSRHLTALQEAGQIKVQEDPSDARTFLVEITPAGERDRAATAAVGAAQFGRAIAGWSDAEVDDAHRVVRRLLDAWAPDDAPDRSSIPPDLAGISGPRWMHRRVLDEPVSETNTTKEQPR